MQLDRAMEYVNNTSLWNDVLTTGLSNEDSSNILSDLEDVQNIFSFIYISIYSFGLIGVSICAIYKEKNKKTNKTKYYHNDNNNNNNNTSNNSGILFEHLYSACFCCLH